MSKLSADAVDSYRINGYLAPIRAIPEDKANALR